MLIWFSVQSGPSLLLALPPPLFDRKWVKWIQILSESAKTAILLNGIPGPWIQIRRGLRQGDPLSPLLFLIVAYVLQKVIQGFCREVGPKHPIVADLTCPVIENADYTLILFQGDPNQARLLKEILDAFSMMTCLMINYENLPWFL
jgi:hypothetical protein